MNWVMISWIFVAILTAINVFFFMKVIYPSMKMMKQMGGADQIQKMMSGMGGMGGGRPGQMPDMGALMNQMNNPQMQAQMKKAMDMLAQMQKNQRR